MTDDPLAKIESYTLNQLHKMWAHEESSLRDANFLPEPAVRAAMVQWLRGHAKIHNATPSHKWLPPGVLVEQLADRLENKK